MEVSEVLLLPTFDLILLSDRKLRAKLVCLVQPRERPCLDAVLHVIDLLHLGQHSLALLFDAVRQHLWRERNLVQGLECWQVHAPPILKLHRRMDVVDGVLEVCEGVGARAGADQALTFPASQKAHMFHHVGDSLLVWVLVDTTDVKLYVCLKTPWRHRIVQKDITHAVWQHTPAHARMVWQRSLCQALWSIRKLDKGALHCCPVSLPVEKTQRLHLLWKRHRRHSRTWTS
mmetsp:Transcript_72389/g.116729  ORF Transcript_72389/g.116729 Transcript_72389/m.116729 type:complete len:231 (+) Transcript_72389:2888-3580(+)